MTPYGARANATIAASSEAHHEHQLLVELRDEALIDPQHRWVVGNPDVNTSWVFYGRPVQAVAAGRVITAVDRFPNQIPNHPHPVTLREADGNHVTIALGHGRYAFLLGRTCIST
jgi:hypothetical protein